MWSKQGRIHDCPCRGRLGRGSNELGRGRNDLGRGINNHRILIPELFYLQIAQKRWKSKVGRTDRPTDRHGDLKVALPATKRRKEKPWRRLRPDPSPLICWVGPSFARSGRRARPWDCEFPLAVSARPIEGFPSRSTRRQARLGNVWGRLADIWRLLGLWAEKWLQNASFLWEY